MDGYTFWKSLSHRESFSPFKLRIIISIQASPLTIVQLKPESYSIRTGKNAACAKAFKISCIKYTEVVKFKNQH